MQLVQGNSWNEIAEFEGTSNEGGCEYEDMIFRPGNRSCGEIEDVCQQYPDLERCTVTLNIGVPENDDPQNCERTVADHCIEPYVEPGYMFNGTYTHETNLACRDLKPLSDFRVTIQDQTRHKLDIDYDGIGCENNNE